MSKRVVSPATIVGSEHPFGSLLKELIEVCDFVCSAPAAAIICGERANLEGAFTLVAPLPLRVYVGSLGRIMCATMPYQPVVAQFKFYDAASDTIIESSGVSEGSELPWLAGKMMRRYAEDNHLRYLPTELSILSAVPPGGGVNWSGAFASALALLIHCLNAKPIPAELQEAFWCGSRTSKPRGPIIQELFQCAMQFEAAAHGRASGYGPAVSLLPACKQLFLFKGLMDHKPALRGDPTRNWGFVLRHWNHFVSLNPGVAKPLEEVLDIVMVSTGNPRRTSDILEAQTSAVETEFAAHFNQMVAEDMAENYPHRSNSQIADRSPLEALFGSNLTANALLGIMSATAIDHLRNAQVTITMSPTGEPQIGPFVRVLQMIDKQHLRLGLSFPELDRLRKVLKPYIDDGQIAVRFTGGGGGGHILVIGAPESIAKVNFGEVLGTDEKLKIVWRLKTDGMEMAGTRAEPESDGVHTVISSHPDKVPHLRLPTRYQALVLKPDNCVHHIPGRPTTLYELRKRALSIWRSETCLLLFHHGDNYLDQHEPLYLTYADPEYNPRGVHFNRQHPTRGGWTLLKDLLREIATTAATSSTHSPTTEVCCDESVLATATKILNSFVNDIGRRSSQTFPTLTRKQLTAGKYEVRLVIPPGSCFMFIEPEAE